MKRPSILKSRYYKKKTNPYAAAIGDFLLVLIPVLQIGIQTAPDMTPSLQHWLQTGVAVVLVTVKFLLKLWKVNEPETEVESNTPTDENIK